MPSCMAAFVLQFLCVGIISGGGAVLFEGLLAGGDVDCSQVGVVTPYKGQVRLLRQLWRERCGRPRQGGAARKAPLVPAAEARPRPSFA